MTETLFEYDHLLMRSEYRTPDIHSHLAIHLIVGLGTRLHCTVADEKFDTESVFIASDVPHTAYSDSGEMLVFLFDPACRYANEIERLYLHGKEYSCLVFEQATTIRSLLIQNRKSMKKADKAVLEYLGLEKSNERKLDERVSEVLTILRETEEVPENAVDFLCDKVRDEVVKRNLAMNGIRVLVIWECTIKTMMRSEAEEQRLLEDVEHFFRSEEEYLEL